MSVDVVQTCDSAAAYLDVDDPKFSIRSEAVREARARNWYARTPYGIAVLRYEEVDKLLRDERLRQGSYRWPAHNKAQGSFAEWWLRMLLNREGQDHKRLRRLANPAFAPRFIASLQPQFAIIANDLIDQFANEGRCEFMGAFSEPYATRVILTLLQLPHDDWRHLADLATQMGLALGVTYHREQERVNAATDELFAYARSTIAERRQNPGDDFISALISANEDKDHLSDQELEDMIVLAVFGGIDTTRNQIGLAMSLFVEHPQQWERLAREPDLARNAVEEVMRLKPTTTWVTRAAVTDFEFQGLHIAQGTTLHLFAESAGTDPTVFPPGFDITQKHRPHFGFGGGIHHCLGHAIARVDMTEALKLLSQRLTDITYDGVPEWLPDSGNTGPIKLPLRFRCR
jgi:cytochrome P450